ncbi:sigma factor regulatory protein HasS [Alcanivorax sp. S71-1-4]|uniref:FecR family protein n=1 Tax=Alcanivorax sp. S71-1-4 TaxID=1177159 RepID=UPI001357D52D|nr:FecR domain-containing protein [Alcanivorax sp. S71-1-4]KAF0808244.1 sigma factor regulatory protein HasS [Alcanivorax sp. S71-1-4]
MHEPNRQPDLLERQAAEWVVRLQRADLPPAERARLTRWLAQSPRHAAAYDRARQAWQLSGALRDDPLFTAPVPRASAVRRYQPLWLAACLMLAVTLGWQTHWWQPLHSDFRTAAGEIRTVTLPDGSEVTLGGATALRLVYTDSERRVALLHGEAIFHPSPRAGSETRPFVVDTAGTLSQALGTRYLVRQLDDQHGWAGVLEHSIQVFHATDERHALTLAAGESARFSPEAIDRSPLDPQQEAAWSRGMLMFRQQPLSEVTARLRQYGAPRTLILNPAVARTPVTAVFRLDNLQQALPTLRQELALRSLQLPGTLVVY